MSSAILAMSLSYYLVMEEQVGKNSKMDEILSSLLSSSKDIYKTVIMSLQGKHMCMSINMQWLGYNILLSGASNGEQIKKFCERHHLNLLLQVSAITILCKSFEVESSQILQIDSKMHVFSLQIRFLYQVLWSNSTRNMMLIIFLFSFTMHQPFCIGS